MSDRARKIYSRQELLKVGLQCEQAVRADYFRPDNVPVGVARPPGSPWITMPPGRRRRRRRDRRQRRGCRAGVLVRLQRSPSKPPLPSIFLANVRSLANKMDELRLQAAKNSLVKDCCVLFVIETWLQPSIPDTAIQLEGWVVHRHDRGMDFGKTRGGGLCVYVNKCWSNNSKTVGSHCSPDLEYVAVKCRPAYLPREFTAVMLTGVYVPPDANANLALGRLQSLISSQQDKYPEAVHIIAGDFNHVELKTVLPTLYQHVKCPTRGDKTLDKVYSNVNHGYRALQLPHLGQSDHMSLFLVPAYIPLRKRAPTILKSVKIWPEGAIHQLQDCFERTNWDIFDRSDLEEHTAAVLCYINHCTDTVTVNKSIRFYPNQKPWMNREVQGLLRERNRAFRSGEVQLYSVARANLKRGIRQAKRDYRLRIEDNLRSNNTRQMWQGIQHITNYKPNLGAVDGDPLLAEELNLFFARFEKEPPETPVLQPPAHRGPSFTVEEHEVRKVLRMVNPRKAAGPDGITGKVLKGCADQLARVFTKIFNKSLHQSIVPPCLKSSTIVPLPKKSTISSLNDYRPVALTPIIMKCFEKLVRRHIISCLPSTFDNYQFAYRANRSTEDAITTTLHAALSHLEQPGSYVRLLFVDFSSAFNTILPHRLVSKLEAIGLSNSTCLWVLDFLSERSQRVRVGSHMSTALSLNTGSPQGCVLSPLLYALYTYDCTAIYSSNKIIKFADDTTVVGLISGGDESAYRDEVERLCVWCGENNLALNTAKTKELVVDYRKKKADIQPLHINGERVERVAEFRFLGVTIDQGMTWSANTTALVKKAQQRIYFLRLLKKNNLSERLLVSFYRGSIESILTYCICAWFSSCTARERKVLQKVITTAQRIIGQPLPSLEELYGSRCLRKANNILQDSSHPGYSLFALLPSGRRYRNIKSRTNRLKNSFYPRAVALLNAVTR